MSNHRLTSIERALACQDVVDHICESLAIPSYLYQSCWKSDRYKTSKCTLARLARTCKAFSDPALRVLWRHLNHIHQLLRLLPEYVPPPGTFSQTYVPASEQALSAVPNDDDWARLQSYAVRVRELKYWPSTRIDSASWRILSEKCSGGPLLPRLERLLCFDIAPHSDAVLSHLFFPLSLRYLSVTFDAWYQRYQRKEHIEIMLRNIVSHASHLHYLSISSFQQMLCNQVKSLHPIQELHGIQSLSFASSYELDDVLLVHCKSSSTLRHLSCKIDTRGATKRPDIRGGFGSLESVSLFGSTEDIVWFFEAVCVDSLRDVAVTFDTKTDLDDLLHSTTKVLKIVSSSLRSFSLEINIDSSEALPLLKSIEPILDLPTIEKFTVQSRQPIVVSADDIMCIANAWRDLRTLHIYHFSLESTPRLPGRILEDIALRCPRLESLKLPVLDFTDLPPQTREPVLDHDLVDLHFFPRSIDDPEDELSDVWPRNLDVIERDLHNIHTPSVWLNAALFVDRLFPRVDLDENPMRRMRVNWYGGLMLSLYLSAIRARREAGTFDKLFVGAGQREDGGVSLASMTLS
ncbi:hypothetical protein L227DRAFT_655508 [Lentinus tigrinus ALCF2SS1-6]|uniref:F-box domain-containing protein n=1 Tax=Lentinus tigrinus ALCF2SS1-6 TaxID=1328759 RepID=A0A5C2S1P4_9APHY|nr:hypothetical protein L227DRAFT_655508 [Lentinus tigrinus ALCF2SS1-6]